jgi:hypothetical protein
MLNISNREKIYLILFHVILGFVLRDFRFISTYYGLGIIIIGTYLILTYHDPKGHLPILFSCYIMGIEVLLRMGRSTLFWEFGKYAIIYFIFLGIVRKSKEINFNVPVLFYFLLLSLSIIMVPFNSFSQWRQDIAFNLSGPAVLMCSSFYFFNTRISKIELFDILSFSIYPIISMAVFVYLKLPEIQSYNFLPYSNPLTSGGYGPNQVSTIFGLGVAFLVLFQVFKYSFSGGKYIDLLLIISLFGLGLLTFSRGGILAVIITLSATLIYYFLHNAKKTVIFVKGTGLLIIIITAWFFIAEITNGVINKRYGLGNITYREKLVLDLTGRTELYDIDLLIFTDNLFTGVGPGQANQIRVDYGYAASAAAHTELSRMLAEHGIPGLISLIIMLCCPIYCFNSTNNKSTKSLKLFFSCLVLLTMLHSAMRIAMTGMLYGFIFATIED